MLILSIVTDADSWYVPHARALANSLRDLGHSVALRHSPNEIPSGDVAFLLSLGQLVGVEQRARNTHNIVVHASALPMGKGWSPLTWQVIEGVRTIPFSLFEAGDRVDAGRIYLTAEMYSDGTELVDELRLLQAETTNAMCLEFIRRFPAIIAEGREQDPADETFYPRRRPADSRLSPNRTLAEQFDILRTCDPERYPAHFEFRGKEYELVLRRPRAAAASSTSP